MLLRIRNLGKTLGTHGRKLSTSSSKYTSRKVAVLGAAGGIGQPLSLLLKHSPLITHLNLYDLAHTPGITADLSHIETSVLVKGFTGANELSDCLRGMDVVIIPAGLPRKPGMAREDLFNTNASVVRDLTKVIAQQCPKAIIAIITNPVNSTVPIASEVMKKAGVYDPRKIFGVTTLDVVRCNAFIGELKGISPTLISCPVIGGHSGVTIIPVLSQCKPNLHFDLEKLKALTLRVQDAGTEVVKAKAGNGSATLSMAYAAARFCFSILRAKKGEQGVKECSYVQSDVAGTKYFATQLLLGPEGVQENLGIGRLSELEEEELKIAIPELKANVEVGEKFINS